MEHNFRAIDSHLYEVVIFLVEGNYMHLNNYIFKTLYYLVVKIKGLPVHEQLSQLQKTQFLPSEKIRKIQEDKLNNILKHAVRNVPFYADRISETAVSYFDLKGFPFVTKREITQEPSAFLSRKLYGKLNKKTTGGSTGEALTVFKDAISFTNGLAATWRGYEWAGVGIGSKQARFWGVPITPAERIKMRLTDFVAHRKRYSAFAFTDFDLSNYTRQLERFDPDYFYGYVSMLNQYADFLIKNKLSFSGDLKSIITTSEVLTSDIRKKLEGVWGVRVYNEYGCGELGTIAHECEYGNLHVNDENMIIEIYDGDRKAKAGEVGEIVVTELNNFAMPLIKYRLGDYASISDKSCQCRRGLTIIDNLYGRAYDMIQNKEGRLFHGEFFMYIFEEAKRKGLGIASFQVIQKDIDYFKIKIVPDTGYSKRSEAYIRDYFQNNFSNSATIDFERVSEIKRTKSGKMRVIIGKNDLMMREN